MNDFRDSSAQPSGAGTATATPAATVTPAAAARDPNGADPLGSLYRMSLTAGLGSGEYVAINNIAVLAFLLGLAGVLALLSPIMLVIVLAALVCGVLALVQIRSSNGTQTGQAFAGLGIVLALVFGGIVGGKMVQARVEWRRSEQEIGGVVRSLSDLVAARQYAQAYQTLFSDKFKSQVSEEAFVSRWESIEGSADGRVVSITWGGRAEFGRVRGADEPVAATATFLNFEKQTEPGRVPMTLVEHQGDWVIETLSPLFESGQDQQRRRADPRVPLGPEVPEAE